LALPSKGDVASVRHEMAALVFIQVNGGQQLTGVGQGKKQLFTSLLQAVDNRNVALG